MKVLLHKVFFDVVYYTRCRRKEGLHALSKTSFDIKTGTDEQDFIEINFNEKTQRNQGDENSSSKNALHNDHRIISSQPGNKLCPVQSFKTYVANLNHDCDAFFQYYSKDRKSYDNIPVGKNSLASMMKEISKEAKLSFTYTNHCIRKTTATALHRKGFDLNDIRNVTKHKNLDSLKQYIGAPMYKEKQNYNSALLSYAENRHNNDNNKHKSEEILHVQPIQNKKRVLNEQNINPENALVPVIDDNNDDSMPKDMIVPLSTQSNVINNQLKSASHLFQNATFNNCNFTFTMPK